MRLTTKFIPGRLYADVKDPSNATILRFVNYERDLEGTYFEYVSGDSGYRKNDDGLIGFSAYSYKYALNKTESKQYEPKP